MEDDIGDIISGQVRGIGTDVAIVSAMVFLAQFILSSLMGTIVQCIGGANIKYGGNCQNLLTKILAHGPTPYPIFEF